MRLLRGMYRFGLLAVPVLLLLLAFLLAATPAQARDLRASVKGVVLDVATGKGVKDVRVYVMEKVYPWGPMNPGYDHDWEPLASGVTGKGGSYTVQLPRAGTFRVFFVPADRERWAMEAYPDAAVPEMGDDVVVKYGKATSGISVKLDPSNRIEGHIHDARSRWDANGDEVDRSLWQGLEGMHVYASFQGLVRINSYLAYPQQPLGDARTDENGSYSIPGFKVPYPFFAWVFDEDGVAPQFTDLIIQDPTTDDFPAGVKVLDGLLQPNDFVNLRGRLVELVDGSPVPVANTTVVVHMADFSPELERPFWADLDRAVTTDGNGYFEFVNLPEPAALLEVQDDAQLQGEFYDNSDFWGAPEIPVDWGRTNDIGDWVISRYPTEGE